MNDHDDRRPPIPGIAEVRAELLRVADDAGPARRRPRSSFLALGAAAVLGAGVGAGFLASSGSEDPSTPIGPSPAFAARGTYYSSPAELIATTALVITGTVREVSKGRIINDDEEFPTTYLDAVVTVDQTLKGREPGKTVVVETGELAFGGPGGHAEWRNPGEQVLLFLSPGGNRADSFTLSNYEQSTYLVEADEVVATSVDPVARTIASLTLDQLERTVAATPASAAKPRGR